MYFSELLGATSCQSSPCLNGGVCVDSVIGFSCNCVSGFGGSKCDVNLGPCFSNPCQNGGSCTNVDFGESYKCTCINKFTGTNCQIGCICFE